MRNKFGITLMGLGTVLILAALSLCLVNQREAGQAGAQAEAVAHQLEQHLYRPEPSGTETAPSLPDPFDPTMTEVEIDGYRYIGTLEIPDLDLSLPVMTDWNYEQLRIAPCRYTGSTKTDDLVIAAHNYAKHFGQLKNLSAGDRVYFTDMDGVKTEYAVTALEILPPTAVEDMSAGAFDLTLFTCTYGGANRVTLRCDRAEREGSTQEEKP